MNIHEVILVETRVSLDPESIGCVFVCFYAYHGCEMNVDDAYQANETTRCL